jgi:hypothetical protein
LVEGGASLAGTAGTEQISALHMAARRGKTSIIAWLVTFGGASVLEVDGYGYTALLCAADGATPLPTVQWLLEHGGSNISDMLKDGRTVWHLLDKEFVRGEVAGLSDDGKDVDNFLERVVGATALLRVMVLQQAPRRRTLEIMSKKYSNIVRDGARIRAGLPAYLAKRRALLDVYSPLIRPLQKLVHDYEVPTTTAELWATLRELGRAP